MKIFYIYFYRANITIFVWKIYGLIDKNFLKLLLPCAHVIKASHFILGVNFGHWNFELLFPKESLIFEAVKSKVTFPNRCRRPTFRSPQKNSC
jgi:hypothetical protein